MLVKGKKKSLYYFIFVVALAVAALCLYLFRNDTVDLQNRAADLTISADSLLKNLSKNNNREQISLKPEQVVEISGIVWQINSLNGRATILLRGQTEVSPYVICDMVSEQEMDWVKKGDTVRIKGIFKGVLKDAIFLNCIIAKNSVND